MSNLTIINALKEATAIHDWNYTLLSEQVDCGQTTIEFTLTGDGTRVPIKLDLSGTPDKEAAHAEGTIYAIGGGDPFTDSSGNPTSLLTLAQKASAAGGNTFVHADAWMQFTGTKTFRMTVQTTTFAKNPKGMLAMMFCDCPEYPGNCPSTFVHASFSMTLPDNPVAISAVNNSTMYF